MRLVLENLAHSFQIFEFRVSDGNYEWVVWKRFSECLALYEKVFSPGHCSHRKLEKLEKRLGCELPDFPPRRPRIFMDHEFLQLRRQGLEAFFRALDDKAYELEALKLFFDVYNPDLKKRVRPTNDSYLTS